MIPVVLSPACLVTAQPCDQAVYPNDLGLAQALRLEPGR